ISKRARQIAEEAEKNHTVLDEKPVELAVREYVNHKFTMVEKVGRENQEEN
ncbi:MAG TPA: DNA-directed RNA polymerase subunit omega, partial [Ruminococcaceae bacterium]|nr:DNA-directed RNA polymerase subunit omega [Oscillospiraceae bacterium]HCB91743.1 DNA-directed RNA polymerase subunit omega [Oscillospiraceae bacterium]